MNHMSMSRALHVAGLTVRPFDLKSINEQSVVHITFEEPIRRWPMVGEMCNKEYSMVVVVLEGEIVYVVGDQRWYHSKWNVIEVPAGESHHWELRVPRVDLSVTSTPLWRPK